MVARHEINHVPTHHELLELHQAELDNVKVLTFFWYYEQRYVYQHSYIVLEAELSEFERSHKEMLGIPTNQTSKFYVTEKNDLGIIWNVFYDFKSAKEIKTEHNGDQFKRNNIGIL